MSALVQAPRAVVMIRPHHFTPNPSTAADNGFQRTDELRSSAQVAREAHAEASRAAEMLEAVGITVHLFEDEGTETPDSVFPNNWFSTHAGGHVAIYPMYSPNRRQERRHDIIEMLKRHYRVQDVIDYSGLEQDAMFLEGTGAMVLDHIERVAYAARSMRTNEVILERFCTHFNFEPIVFDAADVQGRPIYHTNVLMCIGTGFALISLATINHPARRTEILARLQDSGRTVIDLSQEQVSDFCGNALELRGAQGTVIAISSRALAALTPTQRAALERQGQILPLQIPTIELAGGSVRCMLAGVHLVARSLGPIVTGSVVEERAR